MSYEYVACQQKKQGVLVLSEFAGAAQSLNGSIVVNPWDSQAVADAMFEAVTMPAEARALNHEKLFKVSLSSSGIFGLIAAAAYLWFYLSLVISHFIGFNADVCVQYVTKYSAAFWGTSFVREMTKIRPAPALALSPTSPTSPTSASANSNSNANTNANANNNAKEKYPNAQQKEQAVLTVKGEDAKGSVVLDGRVPLTPPVNALAPSTAAPRR